MPGVPGALGAAPDEEPLGPPALYEQLRAAGLVHAGRVQSSQLRIDRFAFELTDGQLYLTEPVAGRITGAVFLGRGTIRAYPPDAVEHQQLKKHLDADYLEDDFARVVLRFSDDTGARLQALAEPGGGGDLGKASAVFKEQREGRFKDVLSNPDSRILADLVDLDRGVRPSAATGYFLALVDGNDRGWFAVEIEPREIEEVSVARYDRGREMTDTWMGTHALADFDAGGSGQVADPFAGFAVDPASLEKDDDDITGLDLGLSGRPREPDHERWAPEADVPIVTTDLALESGGKATGTTALLVEPLRELAAVRLRISPWLQVTDVRWRAVGAGDRAPADDADASAFNLLARQKSDEVGQADPSEPGPVTGERVHVVQERRSRAMTDDWFEPWVTIALPRSVSPGERFVLELAYEGKLLQRLQVSRDYLLKDTLHWMPMHPDHPHSRFHLTFRMGDRDEVVSSGELVADEVEEKTRIVRRLVRTPALYASFHYGRFDVTTVAPDGLPPITLYEDRNRLGVSPGTRAKTFTDLAGALRTQGDYFGRYPFGSLAVTETPATSGQAFSGFLLLPSQTFGELYTGEAELFRAHEVAHQWWGAGVHWQSYRDQWLSEGFAQYAAALYVLAGLEDEPQFRDILTAWRHDVVGEVNIGQGNGRHYGFRPAVIRKSQGSASGALVTGFRLQSTKTPFDYRLLVYEKGAFVLHMLRTMLLDLETGDDVRYRALMTRFASEQMHQMASTATFEQAVTTAFDEPMDWFFDQWVYGVDVPTYRADLRVVAGSDVEGEAPFRLSGTVQQEDVPDGFRMPVPIAVRFADRPPLLRRVWVDTGMVDVDLPLPARPTEVEFNYLNGVLANLR
jgi:hypothetical protein